MLGTGADVQSRDSPYPKAYTDLYREAKTVAGRIDCVVWDFVLCGWRWRQWKQKQHNQL